jgi:hypothetical protein
LKKRETHLDFITKHQSDYGGKETIVALNMLNGMYYTNKLELDRKLILFKNAIRLGNDGNEIGFILCIKKSMLIFDEKRRL